MDGQRLRDPKLQVPETARVELRRRRFVSRGGEKLAAAIRTWSLPVAGSVWIDAGSSTGGFTDALLQNGAAHVHAVDVGTNQLAYALRQDRRVSVMEGTNLFALEDLDPPADYACCDLSFRSLAGAAAHLLRLTRRGRLIALVKPQFELPPGGEHFDGVLRDERLLREVLLETLHRLGEQDGALPFALLESPIRGTEGNREFLLDLRSSGAGAPNPEALVSGVLDG